MKQDYLCETNLLDYDHASIQALVAQRGWKQLAEFERIGAVYDFMQNQILFGYNLADDIPASEVLADGYGQCNTKSTLCMALLRCVGIPCRLHAFLIDNELQHGAISPFWLRLAGKQLKHSWVEVLYKGDWIALEGLILDKAYLQKVQAMFPDLEGPYKGYGIAVKDFQKPPIEWQGEDTFIQKESIGQDLGIFVAPDDFYEQVGGNLSGFKKWAYQHFVRHIFNRNVAYIREN
jgi:hypothetical protein